MAVRDLARELERNAEDLGYEVVEFERAGSARRPILRLRIDRVEGAGEVTVDDCTRLSRAIEPMLDTFPGLDPHYTLEVSSPGVERRLVRSRDFQRFAGREISVSGSSPLAGKATRLEGTLLGLEGEGLDERIFMRLPDGEEVAIPRPHVTRANLIFRWGQKRPRTDTAGTNRANPRS